MVIIKRMLGKSVLFTRSIDDVFCTTIGSKVLITQLSSLGGLCRGNLLFLKSYPHQFILHNRNIIQFSKTCAGRTGEQGVCSRLRLADVLDFSLSSQVKFHYLIKCDNSLRAPACVPQAHSFFLLPADMLQPAPSG